MKIYQVKAWTKPLDWAASSQHESLGFYKTQAGAEARIKDFKKQKDWKNWYSEPSIWPVEVQD